MGAAAHRDFIESKATCERAKSMRRQTDRVNQLSADSIGQGRTQNWAVAPPPSAPSEVEPAPVVAPSGLKGRLRGGALVTAAQVAVVGGSFIRNWILARLVSPANF